MSREARPASYVHEMPDYLSAGSTAEGAIAAVRSIQVVVDEATAAAASEALVNASSAVKAIDNFRKNATAPYRNSTKTIDAEFKEMAAPLKGAEEALKKQLVDYQRERGKRIEEERRRQEEEVREAAEAQRKVEEEAAKAAEEARVAGEPEPPPPPPAPEPPPPPPPPAAPPRVRHSEAGSVSMRTVRKFEVINEQELERQYLVPSAQIIKRAVDDGVEEIPGVRIWSEQVPVARARR